MPPGILGYQYDLEKQEAGQTALRGLPVYLDVARGLAFGEAFIPGANEPLGGLARVNRDLAAMVQSRAPEETATLGETHKEEACHSYRGFKAYQPLQVYGAEPELLLFAEFRDGNAPAGVEKLRVLPEALKLLPPKVEQVRQRTASAGYQYDRRRYGELGEHRRFGRWSLRCAVP